MRLVNILDRYGGFLDQLSHAQLAECSTCVIQGAVQDLLDCADAFGVQALLSLHWTNIDERITDKLLLLRRHQSSLQYFRISPPICHLSSSRTALQSNESGLLLFKSPQMFLETTLAKIP